ncbi:hypothetical protein Dsin_000026 [Dipteronia sinensis]|uniref:BED-type domain-containing protein n=1 Tax=Dipteronia sinensis TaxID=43782 RepID=A0AAD9YZT9_9ROSI|nr:hypothetical protein Dsin_000026 [Dipteronia sinensis]
MEQFVHKVEIESDIFNKTMDCDSAILPIYTDKEYESSNNHSKSRSKVWDVFQKISAERDEDSKAICSYCKKVYSAKAANGTSHLRRHLESCLKPDNRGHKRIIVSFNMITMTGIQAIWKTKWKTITPVPVTMLMIIRVVEWNQVEGCGSLEASRSAACLRKLWSPSSSTIWMGKDPNPSAIASNIFFISDLNSSTSTVPLLSKSNLSNMES